MTDYELAMLRLEAWKALAGWGVLGDPKAKDLLGRLVTPWNWEERMQRAAELAEWAMGKDEKAPPT